MSDRKTRGGSTSKDPLPDKLATGTQQAEMDTITRGQLMSLLQEALRDPLTRELIAETVSQQMKQLVSKVNQLEESNTFLKERVQMLETRQDSLDQYSRRSCLRISTPWKEEHGEDTDELTIKAASLAGVTLTKSEIEVSHRVGRKDMQQRPRQIIVKLSQLKKRQEMYRSRNQLKSASNTLEDAIFFNEDLTTTRSEIAHRARKLKQSKRITDTWTVNGAILLRDLRGTIVKIVTPKEMDDFENNI